MDYQTRSEETGVQFFKTATEAFEHAEGDPTVWKISFGGVRLRRAYSRVTSVPCWYYAPIEKEMKER